MEYRVPGGLVIDQEPLIRDSGDIYFDGIHIVFEGQKEKVQFVLSQVTVHFGGTTKRTAYMKSPSKPHITMETNDFRIFDHPALKSQPEVIQLHKKRAAHRNVMIASVLMLVILLFGPIYLLFIEQSKISKILTAMVPVKAEVALGEQVYNLQIKSTGKIIEDTSIKADFNQIAKPLVDVVSQHAPYDFQFHIINDPSINAFAVPGGHIVFNTGLILAAEDVTEIQGVMAHEMAHITERHSLQQMMHKLGLSFVIFALTSGGGDIVGALGHNLGYLSSQNYSRDQETEADIVGFEYMLHAGIDPSGMIAFFEKLAAQESGFMSSKLFEILSTHPGTDNRRKLLQKKLEELKGVKITENKSSSFNFKEFQDKVRRSAN